MRFRRHGTKMSSAARKGRATQRPATRYLHLIPARKKIRALTPPSTSAVPRSGSATMSTMKAAGIVAARSRVLFHSPILSSLVERNQARKITSTGLAISEG